MVPQFNKLHSFKQPVCAFGLVLVRVEVWVCVPFQLLVTLTPITGV